MSRQLRKSAVWMAAMALAAGAAGLYAWLGVKAPEERAERRKAAEEKLLRFDAPAPSEGADVDVVRVVVESRGEVTTLERQESGAWRIVSPVVARVDAFQVDSLVSQLTGGNHKGVVDAEPSPEALQRYGLSPPRLIVRATAKPKAGGDPREFVLKGGAENAFDGSFYLQKDDDPRVLAAEGGVRWGLDKTTFDLRDKEVLAVELDPRSVEVTAPTHRFALQREGDDGEARWRLTRPAALPADKQAVERYLVGLKNFRAVAFGVDSADERARVGLDEPQVVVVVRPARGEPVRLELSQVQDGDTPRTYALRSQGHETTLAEVEMGAVAALDSDPKELRDRAVLAFDKAKVARLEFWRADHPKIVVERAPDGDGGSGEAWRVVEPKAGPAKKFKLSSILWSLGSLKASAFGEEKPKSWAKWGLDRPWHRVEVLDAQGRPLATLAVGAEVPGKENTRYARGSREQVVELETGRLADLPESVTDLFDEPAAAPAPAVP